MLEPVLPATTDCIVFCRSVNVRTTTTSSYTTTAAVRGSLLICEYEVPVDIQHNQCPCRFLILQSFQMEGYKCCSRKTTPQRYTCIVKESGQWQYTTFFAKNCSCAVSILQTTPQTYSSTHIFRTRDRSISPILQKAKF